MFKRRTPEAPANPPQVVKPGGKGRPTPKRRDAEKRRRHPITAPATGKDASGNNVAISTEVQGIVDSVDLSASPPLLSIGGTSYTTDKIKRVVRPSTST